MNELCEVPVVKLSENEALGWLGDKESSLSISSFSFPEPCPSVRVIQLQEGILRPFSEGPFRSRQLKLLLNPGLLQRNHLVSMVLTERLPRSRH